MLEGRFASFTKDLQFHIRRAETILPADARDFLFFDCAYEGLLQALEPINDDASVHWTMFNDEVQIGFFDLYDQYLFKIFYDPRNAAAMTREEVRAALPQVLADVRAWIESGSGAATDAVGAHATACTVCTPYIKQGEGLACGWKESLMLYGTDGRGLMRLAASRPPWAAAVWL